MIIKFPTRDDVRLGEQRYPAEDGLKAAQGIANALLMEAVCAAVLLLIYEGFRLFCR